MSKKILISLICLIVAITILVIGILIGKRFSDNSAVNSENIQKEAFQAGWDAAKTKFNKVYSQILLPDSITNNIIIGVIHEIDGNKLKVAIRSTDPLNDATPSGIKTITVSDSTKIAVSVPQDPEAIKKKIQEGDFDSASILPEYQDSKLSDLKVNQFVMVSATKDNNELIATEIKANYVDPKAIPEKSATTQE